MHSNRTQWAYRCWLTALLAGAACGCSLPHRFRSLDRSKTVIPLAPTHASPDASPAVLPNGSESGEAETPFKPVTHSNGDMGIRLAAGSEPQQPSVQQAVETHLAMTPQQMTLQQMTLQQMTPQEITQQPFSSRVVTLSELEAMALQRNPSLQQLAAAICKAEGVRNQVGLLPNPVIGYQGVQLADRGTDQHTFFVEREWVTGNKLDLNRRVHHQALEAQKWELETQRYRVLTDLRLKYLEAYTVQQRLKLLESFEAIASKGLEMSTLRKKGMEGSQLEVLQAGIQRDEMALNLQQSRAELTATLQGLFALLGDPCFTSQVTLAEPSFGQPNWSWDELRCRMLADSPELQVAYHRLAQAQANVQRQHAQPIPNVTLQVAGGIDNGTDSGMMNVQVGAPIPTNNKNQGNILAAHAEVQRASAEIQRLEGAIASRLAEVARDYETALIAVQKYETEILPKAEETIQLAEKAYQAGEYTFIEILMVRRTYFDANLKHLAAKMQLAQSQVRADGFMLTGAWDATLDYSSDDGLRGQTFSQQ